MTYAAFRNQFAAALDNRFYPIECLDALVANGEVQGFYTDTSAIIVEIKVYPSGVKTVAGVVAAGDKQEIAEQLIPRAEEFGRELGCQFGMIESRQGWSKVMAKHGYRPFQTAIVKEL
jgi:hypothetical protein